MAAVVTEQHYPTGLGNMFGGYDCACGEAWTRFHEALAIRDGFYDPRTDLVTIANELVRGGVVVARVGGAP